MKFVWINRILYRTFYEIRIIYSLSLIGVLLYELLTMVPEKDKLQQIQELTMNSISENQSLHQYEKGLIGALINEEKDHRPDDIQEIIEATDMIQDKFKGTVGFLSISIYTF